jgi:hypothetical protein
MMHHIGDLSLDQISHPRVSSRRSRIPVVPEGDVAGATQSRRLGK